ncbi:MAG: 4Fe-4S binding protein [Bacteroidales bacterium]
MFLNFVKKLPRLLFIALLLIAIGIQSTKHSGALSEPDAAKNTNPGIVSKDTPFSTVLVSSVSLTEVKNIYPQATQVKQMDSLQHQVYNAKGDLLGTILHSEYTAPKVMGFGGTTPLCIFLDINQKIIKVELLPNAETGSYVDFLKKNNYLEQWNGKTPQEVVNTSTDALSGCTYTSTAVKENMLLCMEAYTHTMVVSHTFDYLAIARNVFALIVVLFGLLSFLYPKKLNKYRLILLALSFIVLGIWQAKTLSLSLLYGFISHGFSWSMWFLIGLLLLSIILSLFTNKAFYCTYICPFGAAQELAGKIVKRKWTLPRRMAVYLSNIREEIILVCMFLAITQIVTDFSQVEVFSAFGFSTASIFVQILFGVFLLLSVFFSKPWCRFFCPTGFLLELMRKPLK